MKTPHLPRRKGPRPIVRPIAFDRDGPGLPALFRSFGGKAFQQRVQGIDADTLADFLAERALASARTHHTWVAEQARVLIGLAALQTGHWHGQHCGFGMGKVTQLMTAPGSQGALKPMLAIIEGAARTAKVSHLTARVDAHDFAAQEILTSRRWYPTGTSIKLVARLTSTESTEPPGLLVRPYDPADRERVLQIATQSHEENHLHFDPHLPAAGTHAIFARWVEMCLDGQAAQIWVGEDVSSSRVASHDSRVIGFVTILDPRSLNRAMGTKIAVLDFIVLADETKGRGLGSALLQAVHARVAASGFDQIELRTTATNFAAVNLYAKHGYKLVGTDQVFGRWLGKS